MTDERLQFRHDVLTRYPDVLTHEVCAALNALAPFDARRKQLLHERSQRRDRRARGHTPITFLPEDGLIPGTQLSVRDARAGAFEGSAIPEDLQRQWIQGT